MDFSITAHTNDCTKTTRFKNSKCKEYTGEEKETVDHLQMADNSTSCNTQTSLLRWTSPIIYPRKCNFCCHAYKSKHSFSKHKKLCGKTIVNKISISYPRKCNSCCKTYKCKQSFSNHKKSCGKKRLKVERKPTSHKIRFIIDNSLPITDEPASCLSPENVKCEDYTEGKDNVDNLQMENNKSYDTRISFLRGTSIFYPRKCDSCFKTFKSKQSFSRHKMLCGKNPLSTEKKTILHKIRFIIDNSLPTFTKCNKCRKDFDSKTSFDQHLKKCTEITSTMPPNDRKDSIHTSKMNEEFTMIFNGDEAARLTSNGETASHIVSEVDGVIEAFYNEMQRNMLQNQDADQLIVDDSQSSISGENFTPFKALESDDSKINSSDHQIADGSGDQTSLTVKQDQTNLSVSHNNNSILDEINIMDLPDSDKFNIEVPSQNISTISDQVLSTEVINDGDPNLKEDQHDLIDNITTVPVATVNGSDSSPKDETMLPLCDVNSSNSVPKDTDDDDDDGEIKAVVIPDNWQITILEDNGSTSHSAEPLIASEQGVYQLWECPKCTALFREKDICESHIVNAHVFTCSLCQEPCDQKEALEEHIVQHISEFQYVDMIPARASTSKKRRYEDSFDDIPSSKKVKRDLRDTCSQTEMPLKPVSTLNDTNPEIKSQLDDDEKPVVVLDVEVKNETDFFCDACGKEYSTYESLQLHQQSHMSAQSKFRCPVCAAVFSSKIPLEDHMSKHAKKSSKNFQCHYCKERFSKSTELKSHLRTHEDALPFRCDYCGERYAGSSALLRHTKERHPNVKGFNCIECGKSFKIKPFLEAHMSEVHQSERKKCRYCSKTYKSYEHLIAHVQESHDREESKHYDCDYCSSSFSTNRDLKRHMEIHLSSILQTYDCEQCGSTFSSTRELRIHMQLHQNTGMYHCDWCSRSFDFKKNLDVHIKVHHSPMYHKMDLEDE